MKTPAFTVHLDAAFHHHGPGHQRALRRHPGAVALVAAEVARSGTQRFAPEDGAAVVARMATEGRVRHLGQQRAHHRRIAAEAIAGQQQGVARQQFFTTIGALVADTDDPVFGIEPQRVDQRLREHRDAGRLHCGLQARHQRRAGLLRQRVHAVPAVAGIEKTIEHDPVEPVPRLQRIERRADRFRVRLDQRRGRIAMRLGLDVRGEAIGAVVDDALRPLCTRVRRGDEAGRQRRRAARHCVAFEHHAVDAGVVQHQRGGQAAGARADDGDRGAYLGIDLLGAPYLALQDRGRSRRGHASAPTKPAQSVTSATLRMSASEVWWRSSPKAAQPSPSTSVR